MKTRTKVILVVITVVVLGGVAAGALYLRSLTDDRAAAPAVGSTSDSGLTVITQDLEAPWSVAFYGDTALVSLRDSGQILEINSADGSTRAVGTVEGAVHRGEGGLLGLATDEQDRLYAYYTTDGDNRISRYTLGGEPGNLSLGAAETIIEGLPSASNHNGGRIAFGPDGMLYATVGDASSTANAQDLDSLGGKILRLTPDGDVPSDNPFAGSYVYSYGHRNPQGIAWDESGTMYASEFGQNTWDELNIIEAGKNYGWPDVEGIGNRDGFVDPAQQWATSSASPSGMAFANGRLYIANLRGEVLRTVSIDTLGESQELYKGEYGRLRDVVISSEGRVWLITNNTDGRGVPVAGDDRIIALPTDQ
jgi:glucose/arabinose dehydrogenase